MKTDLTKLRDELLDYAVSRLPPDLREERRALIDKNTAGVDLTTLRGFFGFDKPAMSRSLEMEALWAVAKKVARHK